MHSKVIIASLVCMLAASFGNSRTMTATKSMHSSSNEAVLCAPNDSWSNVVFDQKYGNAGTSLGLTIEFEKELLDFDVVEKSDGLSVDFLFADDFALVEASVPATAGNYYAKFGYYEESNLFVVASIYIYTDGVHYYASSLSSDDAKSQFFIKYVATQQEIIKLLKLDQYVGGNEHGPIDVDPPIIVIPPFPIPNPNPPTIINNKPNNYVNTALETGNRGFRPAIDLPGLQYAINMSPEEHYSKYVYDGSNDITTTVSYEESIWPSFTETEIQTNINWIDINNNAHPVRGVNARLMVDNGTSSIAYGKTLCNLNSNHQGVGNAFVSSSVAVKHKMNNLYIKLTATNNAVRIFDDLGIDYSYFYRFTSDSLFSTPYLSNYSKVTLNINIYPGLSDRADAFEIAEAENLPYNYCNAFNSGVSRINLSFPSNHSQYNNLSGSSSKIEIQKEDAHNWDVLNHEYGHYICGANGFANQFSARMPHKINDNLANLYGAEDGLKLAYSEGLATYIGLASQMYGAANSNIPGVGDATYLDELRGININYREYAPGLGNNPDIRGEVIESAVTSFLLKLTDYVNVPGDRMGLSDANMWEIITETGSNCSIIDFVLTMFEIHPGAYNYINELMPKEHIHVDRLQYAADAWTILIYDCDVVQYSRPLIPQLTVDMHAQQPDDVNIVIEQGGGGTYQRFHLENGQANRDVAGNSNMGSESSLISFLNWGIKNFPARKIGLILRDHGRALNGVCFQEVDGDEDGLSNFETRNALRSVFATNNIEKLEFIGYDACLMQVQDIAEFNSPFFKYMVASEELQSSYGWRYDLWVEALYKRNNLSSLPEHDLDLLFENGDIPTFAGETLTILRGIVHSFCFSDIQQFDRWEQELSIIDLSKMGEYLSLFEAFSEQLNHYIFDSNPSLIQERCESFEMAVCTAKQYAVATPLCEGKWSEYGTNDVYCFLENLKESECFNCFSSTIDNLLNYIYPDIVSLQNGYDDEEAIFGPNSRRTLVVYDRSSPAWNQESNVSHGLAMHVWLTDEQTYDQSHTNFQQWRNLFVRFREAKALYNF